MGSTQNKEVLWSSSKQRAELGSEHSETKKNPLSVGRGHPEVPSHSRLPKPSARPAGREDRARRGRRSPVLGRHAPCTGPGWGRTCPRLSPHPAVQAAGGPAPFLSQSLGTASRTAWHGIILLCRHLLSLGSLSLPCPHCIPDSCPHELPAEQVPILPSRW